MCWYVRLICVCFYFYQGTVEIRCLTTLDYRTQILYLWLGQTELLISRLTRIAKIISIFFLHIFYDFLEKLTVQAISKSPQYVMALEAYVDWFKAAQKHCFHAWYDGKNKSIIVPENISQMISLVSPSDTIVPLWYK